MAEFDFLHARLNVLSKHVGAPSVSIYDFEATVLTRMERIAHLGGVEEHRPDLQGNDRGWQFWTDDAYGFDESSSGYGAIQETGQHTDSCAALDDEQ